MSNILEQCERNTSKGIKHCETTPKGGKITRRTRILSSLFYWRDFDLDEIDFDFWVLGILACKDNCKKCPKWSWLDNSEPEFLLECVVRAPIQTEWHAQRHDEPVSGQQHARPSRHLAPSSWRHRATGENELGRQQFQLDNRCRRLTHFLVGTLWNKPGTAQIGVISKVQ